MSKRRPTHKSTVTACRDLVRLRGGEAWVLSQVGSLCGDAGVADIYCVYRGQPFWIEVKVGKDKLRPEQRRFRDLCGLPVVIGGLDELQPFLRSIDETKAPDERAFARQEKDDGEF